MDDLKGKVAIITGGGYGIGKKIAEAYAALGLKIVLAARTVKALDETSALVKRAGAEALVVPTDVAKEADCANMVARAVEIFGAVDILVNNAGISGPTSAINEIELAQWEETLNVNLTGAWLCAREALKVMGPRGQGNVLNISSTAGRIGYALRTPYVSSKWAMIGLTQTLAREWGPHGIRVNCICPGPVEGDRIDRVIRARAQALKLTEEQVRRAMCSNAALGRMVTEEEVARAAVFLTSAASSGITGQTLNVDAGYIMN
jgi:NAD(P)-dependent dehydrogenase (short-subunit alcohol dehydrogenase family)